MLYIFLLGIPAHNNEDLTCEVYIFLLSIPAHNSEDLACKVS